MSAAFAVGDVAVAYGVGDVVAFDSPDWGPSEGTILAVSADRALVQDHHPIGGREYWPVADLELVRRGGR